jgi:hypothetical protein
MSKKRDYAAEYLRRKQSGQGRGLSLAQIRGHACATKGELPASVIKIKPTGNVGEKFDYVSRQMLGGKSATAARKEVGLSKQQFNKYRLEKSPSIFKSGKRYKAKQFKVAYFTPGTEEVQYSTFTGASSHWMRNYRNTLAILQRGDKKSASYKKAVADFAQMTKDLKSGKVKISDVEGKRVHPSTSVPHIDYLTQQLTETELQDYQESSYRLAEAA